MEKPKLLELFAGSKSWGNAAMKLGYEVYSTDFENFEGIDLVKDILDIEKKDIKFYPDVICGSPPCEKFSVGSIGVHWYKNHNPKTEEAKHALKILEKTIEIFSWFPDAIFYMENPRGKMRKKINGTNRITITYCSYGDTRMKPTDIWSNNIYDIFNPQGWRPRAMCFNGNKKCHHEEAPRGSKTGTQGLKTYYERSMIPEQLCYEILKQTLMSVKLQKYRSKQSKINF